MSTNQKRSKGEEEFWERHGSAWDAADSSLPRDLLLNLNERVAQLEAGPIKGFVVITIPVGNIPPKDVPEYLHLLADQILGDGMKSRIKKAGYDFFFIPARGHEVSPKIELLRLDNDRSATVDLAKLLENLPDNLKARIEGI